MINAIMLLQAMMQMIMLVQTMMQTMGDGVHDVNSKFFIKLDYIYIILILILNLLLVICIKLIFKN
jgi:hypothetical protein